MSTYMLLLLLVVANLLFVGNPYVRLLRLKQERAQWNIVKYWCNVVILIDLLFINYQVGSVDNVGVPITCHPVRKNIGGFMETLENC